MAKIIKDAILTGCIAGLLALPLAGARTIDGSNGLTVEWHLADVGIASLVIFLGRIGLNLEKPRHLGVMAPLAFLAGLICTRLPFPSHFLQIVATLTGFIITARAIYLLLQPSLSRKIEVSENFSFIKKLHSIPQSLSQNLVYISWLLLAFAVILPFTPFATRYVLDVGIMVLTYVMLAWGLNITVGYSGLLDLGYAGFYALGAYSLALITEHTHIGFWTALPLSGLITAMTGFLLGFPVLRLRGDYFAIVTLGFGEIVRLVLINWTTLTGGPNGISGIEHPTLFGLEFVRQTESGDRTFSDFFHVPYSPMQRVIFLYFIILLLAVLVGWLSARLRRLPIGRAWEAFREDEIACAALGINRWKLKLSAYSLGAMVAGIAGAFFATRQGFISPESFTFTESATMLAIVILGGIGDPLGILLAACFIIGLPELFRELEQYRMLAFGIGMVLIMIWRPGGMMSKRKPTVLIPRSIAENT